MQEMNEVLKPEESRNGSITKLISVILMVMFFFPLCTVSCGDNTVEVNGIKATFGMDVLGEHIDGNMLCGLLFLIPCIILIVFLMKRIVTEYMAFLTMAGAFVDIIILIVLKNKITNLAEEAFLTVEFTGWYYGQVICNVLLVVLAFISYCGLAILYSQGQVRISSGRKQEDERKNHGNDNSSFAIIVAAYIACAIIVITLLIGQQYVQL